MEPVSFIPLDARVCIQILVAGHLDGDGKTLPKCIGPTCSQYELCKADVLEGIKRIAEVEE